MEFLLLDYTRYNFQVNAHTQQQITSEHLLIYLDIIC